MFSTLLDTFANLLSITDTNEKTVLGWFLDGIDNELKFYGLIWTDSNTTAVKELYSNSDEYRSFYITFPFQNAGHQIKIKSLNDSNFSETLTIKKDYLVSENIFSPNPIFAIELRNRTITSPQYLEITAVWKFGDTLPNDLKTAVLNLASEYMGLYNQNLSNQSGQVTKSTRIDEVSFSFGDIQTEKLKNYKTYKVILNRYMSL